MPTGGSSWSPSWSDDPGSVVDPLALEAIGRRIRYLNTVAPDAAADPGALQGLTQLAQNAATDEEFQTSVDEMYGFNESGKRAAELMEMPADLARIHYDALPASMKVAVRRQGFAPKAYGDQADNTEDDKESGIGKWIPGVGNLVQEATGFIGEEILHPVGSAFEALGRASTQAYRTGVAVDDEGRSFLDPGDWMKAWSEVGNGATYLTSDDRSTVKEQYDLNDEELDTYLKLSQGFLPGEIAEDEGHEVGTEEHTARVRFLYDLASSETGLELVGDPMNGSDGMLNNYRVSFGRFWSRRGGFQPKDLDNGFGKLVSGSGDMLWAITADPTLVAGKAFRTVRQARIAMSSMDDVSKTVDAAFVARMLDEEGWSASARLGVPGARGVVIRDNTGKVMTEMAASRLALGQRSYKANQMIAKAMRFDNGDEGLVARDELFRTFPGMLNSFTDLVAHNNELLAKGQKGLDTVDGIEDFLVGTDGYRMLTASKFGGRNTAEFLRVPEVGRSTELKMRAKGSLQKAQDWAGRMDTKLAEDIGVAPGRFTQIINNVTPIKVRKLETVEDEAGKATLALSVNPLRTAARAGLSPIRFSQVFTTHIPRGGWIGLWKADDLSEFDRYLQYGRSLGMDSRQLSRYRDDFIGWGTGQSDDDIIRGAIGMSAANRATVIRTFTTDLLSRFDIPEDSDLYRKFVARADETYALNPDGTAKAGRAVTLSQTAEAMAIPSFRDLMMVTNRYSTMRSIFGRGGVLNPRLLDAGLTRYWKPSVLMRVGFIGRAAGEELLAYLARFGSAHYFGTTLATGAAKQRMYDDIMSRISVGNPTKELIEDLRSHVPDQWEDMVAWQGAKGVDAQFVPSPREVLSWGQSQALAPYTGIIHAMDSLMQKVILAPWVDDVTKAPAWRVKAAERMRRIDNHALRTSIRVAKANKRIASSVNRTVSRVPGLHQTAEMLDATLFPIISRYAMDMPTFVQMSESAIPSKEMAARLLAHLDDDDFESLQDMLTDPVVRRAQLEHVIGGDTLAVNIEPGTTSPAEISQTVPVYNPRTGQSVEQRLVPEGNKMGVSQRPDGVMNGQQRLDYYQRYQERLRHIFNPKSGLGRAALTELSNHIPQGMAREISSQVRGVGVPLGEGLDDVGTVAAFVREVRTLPYDQQKALALGVENNDMQRVAADLAAGVKGDGVEEVLHRKTLEALAAMGDRKIQHKVLNPKLDPDRLTTSFEQMVEDLRVAIRRVYGTPREQRLLYGHEGWAEQLTQPPRQGYLPAYSVAANQDTARWSLKHLNGALDPDLKAEFQADLALRLKVAKLPPIEAEVADELFNPDFPAQTVFDAFVGNGHRDSIPLSLAASSDVDLADEVVNALASVTGRQFHLQRLDVPQSTLQSRPTGGTGGVILDGQPDWEQSILWRVQMEDFSGAVPLPVGARRYLVKAPEHPQAPVVDATYGPVEPQTAYPTTARWDWPGNEEGNTITDIVDNLPLVERGKIRIYGERPTWETRGGEHGVVWHTGEPEDFLNQLEDLPYDWYFTDIPEDEYRALVESGQLPNAELDAHHFASDGEEPISVGPEGDIETGFGTRPRSFEYVMLPESNWMPGFSPVHYVAEHEATLRRLSNRIEPWPADEVTDEVSEVVRRLGLNPENLARDDLHGRIARRALAGRSEEMLIEGRKAGALPRQTWWDEDDLRRISEDMGGEWNLEELEAIHDEALAMLPELERTRGLDVDQVEEIRLRLEASQLAGVSLAPENVAARNAAFEDLNTLVPNWWGSEGWSRVGTSELFDVKRIEPSPVKGAGRKQISVGRSPGEKTSEHIDDQVENIVRHLTSARSGSLGEARVLDEIVGPLAHDPTPTRINLDLVANEPPISDLPLETFGQRYVTPKTYAWDRLTNWFFDDAASQGISSIVRNQLFATNYVKARRLNRGLIDVMTDPALRERTAAIVSKWGMTADDLDELVRMQRHGMITLAHPQIRPWTETVEFGDDVDLLVPHQVELETARKASELDAVTAVQNSVLRVPSPEVSIADANWMLRRDLGLKDTPMAQEIRKATTPIAREMHDEANRVGDAVLDAGGSQEEAIDAVKVWYRDNKEVYDLRFENARAQARAEVINARAAGQQLDTDPEAAAAFNEHMDEMDLEDDLVTDLSGAELVTLRHYVNQQTNALDTLRDSSMQRALEGTIPFIDDHRVRSQFQEYVGNLVPFWFAEEQFLKRWARIFKEAPEAFRRGQLAMHGLRVIGAIQTDMEGRDYYVYPGSSAATSLFTETPVAKLLFGSEASMPVGLSLTGDVKHTLPGFGDQMGVPSAGPFVGVALEMLASRSPEWAQIQQSVMGERGSNRQLYSYIVPTSVTRFYSAFTQNMNESQLASALIETAQLMEASGDGLPEDATADEEQDYLDRVEANARSVQLLRAVTGFVAPASPGIDNAEALPLSEEFESLIQSGIPYTEALMWFMEKHKGEDVSPYTVFRTEVPSSAPLAATQEALEEMDAYDRQLRQFPMAAPWMLLPFRASEDEFTNRAYRQQIRLGLRKYRSHTEYIRALAWADASPEYFDTVEDYDTTLAALRLAGDDMGVKAVQMEKRAFTEAYRNAHPIFADKLLSSEGRVERQQILRESYLLMNHPTVQDNPRVVPMRQMLERYRAYDDALVGLNTSRAKTVLARKEALTTDFRAWLGIHLIAHPELRYFYDRVLRPELQWDRSAEEGMAA